MINNLLTRVFGSRNERLLKQLQRIVDKINALEPELHKLTDEQLKAKTPEFQERIRNGEALDKILPEAFAVCREASQRVLGMRHYDVQLIGGMVLHLGKIAEMRTGEGKDRRRCEAIVEPTNSFEDDMRARSDTELRELTDGFR